MLAALAAYQRALAGREHLICYAMKANSNLAVLQTFAAGRVRLRHRLGRRTRTRDRRRRRRRQDGVLGRRQDASPKCAARSMPACLLQRRERGANSSCCRRSLQLAGRTANVSLRVNPDVDALTHPYISTGLKGNKFGIAHDEALAAYLRAGVAAWPGRHGHRLPHRLADHRDRALPRRARPPARSGRARRSARASGCTTSISAAAWASRIPTSSRRRRKRWCAPAGAHRCPRPRASANPLRTRPLAGGQCRRARQRGAVPQAFCRRGTSASSMRR